MSSQNALITPSVMKWARQRSNFTIEQVSEKIKRPIGDIEAWETGEKLPTIAQARRIAKVYGIWLATLYLSEPPILNDDESVSLQ